MVLLDTNVISELLRDRPAQAVLDWVASQDGDTLFLSAVTEAELLRGVAIRPEGRRRSMLAGLVADVLSVMFRGRILPFDSPAAQAYAQIWTARKAAGRPISGFDCQIAGIATANAAVVATRNVRDFEGCGLALVDPWTAR
ncbi:MAG: type II toxin-antitoxin system VapC family toxin [Oceanicaulis sp.]